MNTSSNYDSCESFNCTKFIGIFNNPNKLVDYIKDQSGLNRYSYNKNWMRNDRLYYYVVLKLSENCWPAGSAPSMYFVATSKGK
jgi:hypothetical protein